MSSDALKKTSRDPTDGGDRARRVGRSRRPRERVGGANLVLQHEFPILVDRRGFRVHVTRHGVGLAGSFPFVSPRRLLGTCSDLRERRPRRRQPLSSASPRVFPDDRRSRAMDRSRSPRAQLCLSDRAQPLARVKLMTVTLAPCWQKSSASIPRARPAACNLKVPFDRPRRRGDPAVRHSSPRDIVSKRTQIDRARWYARVDRLEIRRSRNPPRDPRFPPLPPRGL